MAQRDDPAASKRRGPGRPKGIPATPAQKAAGRANLAKGRARAAELAEENPTSSGERWAMLLDGRLTVRDLSDAEIKKMKVKGRGGAYSMRRMPSHIAQAFVAERNRRAIDGLGKLLPTAIAEAKRILEDPDAKASEKTKIIDMILNRNLGKTPDRLVVEESAFSRAAREVVVDRELDDILSEGD